MDIRSWEKSMFENMSGLDSQYRKTHGITFTPLETVNYMLELLNVGKIDYEHYKVLEPSCGVGIFVLGYMEKIFVAHPKMTDRQIIHLVKNISAYDIQDEFILALRKAMMEMVKRYKEDFFLQSEMKKHLEENIVCEIFLMLTCVKKYDLIIGNPPYVRRHNMDEQSQALVKRKEYKDIYSGLTDLSVFFVDKAGQFLRDGGNILFITSSKFATAKSGSKFRKKYYPSLSFYANEYTTPFEDVQIDTCIMMISSEPTGKVIVNAKQLYKKDYDFKGGEEWNFTSKPVIKKGKTLLDLGITISNGIVSGYNKAHLIGEAQYSVFIKKEPELKKVIKLVLGGKDIDTENKRFKDGRYLIYASGENLKLIEKSPLLMKHFAEHKTDLEKRSWYKSHTSLPYYQLQGTTQHNDGNDNYLTKRIGELSFVRVPSEILYLDTIYNLIYPKDIDVIKLIKVLGSKDNLDYFYRISNRIGKKYEIHKNKFERIVLTSDEIKSIAVGEKKWK